MVLVQKFWFVFQKMDPRPTLVYGVYDNVVFMVGKMSFINYKSKIKIHRVFDQKSYWQQMSSLSDKL